MGRKKGCIFMFLVIELCCFVMDSARNGIESWSKCKFVFFLYGVITNSWTFCLWTRSLALFMGFFDHQLLVTFLFTSCRTFFFLLMYMCLFNGRDWRELSNPIEDRNCRRVQRIWLTEVKSAFRRIKMKSPGTRWNPLWILEVLKRCRRVLVPGWQIFLKSFLVSKVEVHPTDLAPIYKS